MMGKGKSLDQWVDEYAQSHRHPVNRWCHTFGIPLIVISLAALAVCLTFPWGGRTMVIGVAIGAAGLLAGWALQFIGHWFEGKPPEFLKDRRFLFVGIVWWIRKLRGRA